MDDWQLLQEFAQHGSESAFRELVARHLNLVHASACRQVNDSHLAEEVSQAVFILLARKAGHFRRGVVLPGWLFRTTRFVAARVMRSELRRRQREQMAFDMQSTMTPDDAWKTIAPTLDEALAKLSETDRNAVLLRYFEDRSHAQVGWALGLSEEAARKRTDRALEKLRNFFSSRGFTVSVTALASALLANSAKAAPAALLNNTALSALKFGSAAAPALPTLVSQTLQAWRWTKLKWAGALGVAIAAVVTVVIGPPSPKAFPRPVSTATEQAAAPLSRTAMASVPANAGFAATAHTTATHTNVLRFHVVARDTGEAVADANLAVLTVTHGNWNTRYDLQTDESGTCDVPVPPGLGRLDVGVVSSGWGARFVTWRMDRDTLPADYTLRVERVTNSIGGWLRDELGNPVPNARIWIQFGGGGDATWIEAPRERTGFVDFVPVATSDQNGYWSCAVIPTENKGFTIEARVPGFPPAQIETYYSDSYPDSPQSESGRENLRQLRAGTWVTVVKRGISLTGQVTDTEGRAIIGATIVHDPDSTAARSVTTDTNGEFSITNLSAGGFDFVVSAKGYSPKYRNVKVKPDVKPLEIRLGPGARLLLRVVDERGDTVPDATVGVQSLGRHNNVLNWRARSDAEGRVEWNSAPAGESLELFAYKTGWCYTRNIQLKADGQEHTIAMRRALKVSGRVVDAKTGEPVRAFAVFPGYGRGSGDAVWYRSETRHGTNGEFSLDFTENDLPWRVKVEAAGYQPMVSFEIPPDDAQSLWLALKPADPSRAVHGVVLLPDGSPAAGVEVAKLTLDYRTSLENARFRSQGVGLLTNTDASGRFSFAPNPRIHSVAAVGPAGFAKVRVYDPRNPVMLQLQRWGRIEGTVSEAERTRPIDSVVLMDDCAIHYQGSVMLDPNTFSAKPDESGHFRFDRVPPGIFSLYINRGLGIPFTCRTAVTVNEGETSTVQMGGNGCTVTGRLAATQPVADWSKQISFASLSHVSGLMPRPPGLEGDAAALWAVDFWQSEAGIEYLQEQRSSGIIVAVDGHFRADDVKPGRYKLRVSGKLGRLDQEVNVPGGKAEVDLGTFEFPGGRAASRR